MTTITLNNRILSEEHNINASVTDFMDHLLEKHLRKQDVITGISIDGKLLTLEEENQCLPQNINNFKQIDFKVQSSLELAFDALDSCSTYIDVVSFKIKELVELYNANQIEEANLKFGDIIEVMDLFVQLMAKIHKTFKASIPSEYSKGKTIQNLEIHLLSVLKGLVPAKEQNDIIMLCDLLEYELIDNLTQWKIKAIPELKSLRKA